jgi:hypothetical protein
MIRTINKVSSCKPAFNFRMNPSTLNTRDRGHRLADLRQLPRAVRLDRVVVDLGQPSEIVNLKLDRFGHPVNP